MISKSLFLGVLASVMQLTAPGADLESLPSASAPSPSVLRVPEDGKAWENSLGMKFVPAGTPGVLFCVWPTRVSDFRQFSVTTRYPASQDSDRSSFNYWKTTGETWDHPGFSQGDDHPVVAVNWRDAQAFCRWLTAKEQWARVIGPDHVYRLPTDAEWSAAAGEGTTYPWGTDAPVPLDAGNYARFGDGFTASAFTGSDAYKYTSPVGRFRANGYGLFDMGGNVWEWCEDWYRKEMNDADARNVYAILNADGGGTAYRVLRGGSWRSMYPMRLRTSAREFLPAGSRFNYDGFRCVLDLTGPPSLSGTALGRE